MVLALTAFPYARSQGLGTPFHQGSAAWGGLLAAFLAIAAAVLLGGIGGSAMFVGVTIMALLAGWSMIRMLGGLTGDCYGAINEMAESVALVVAVGMLAQGWIEPLPLLLA
jgi:adenosylcobinamide-GDP ribazoletransferase